MFEWLSARKQAAHLKWTWWFMVFLFSFFLFFSDLKSLVGISLCIYLNPAQPLKTREIFRAATRGSLNLILSSPCRCYPRQWRLISAHTCTVSLMRGKRIYPLDSHNSRCFLHQRRRRGKKIKNNNGAKWLNCARWGSSVLCRGAEGTASKNVSIHANRLTLEKITDP